MAVDFSLLPKEVTAPDDPPSRIFWVMTFLVMTVGASLLVLLLWPKHLPTNAWRFWVSLLIFPAGISASVVLRRYAVYEGHRLDALLCNEAVREYNLRVFAVAERPLAMVGTAYRYSSDRNENAVQSIQSGVVRLSSRVPIFSDGDPTRARWLLVPGVKLESGGQEDEELRQMKVARWLFAELLDELAGRLELLPSCIDLGAHVWVSGGLSRKAYLALWRECWAERRLRPMLVIDGAEPLSLRAIDNWLDQVAAGRECEARLVVTIQLYPLLSEIPPAGVAEAGVAVLLMPREQARQHAVACEANLHRPVCGAFDRLDETISRALRWGDIEAAQVSGVWRTGIGSPQAGVLLQAALHLGLSAQQTDLDQTVGHTGTAAPWLAIACGAKALSAAVVNQVVFHGQADGLDAAVIRRVED